MSTIRRLAKLAPLLLYISIGFYVLALLYAQGKPKRWLAEVGLPEIGATVPPLVGITDMGVRIRASSRNACELIHYVAPKCPSCEAEVGLFASAARAASAKGCGIWTIASSSADWSKLFTLDTVGHAPVIYIPFSWSAAVPLRLTPTTILLDRDRRVTWLRMGALDAPASRSLISAISTAAAAATAGKGAAGDHSQ